MISTILIIIIGIAMNIGACMYAKRGLEERYLETNSDIVILIMCFIMPYFFLMVTILLEGMRRLGDWMGKSIGQ